MFKVWWCNQSGSWEREMGASLVCSQKIPLRGSGIYRWMVWLVREGDIVVHYRSQDGVYAISRTKTDARAGKVELWGYGQGWSVKTKYHRLRQPILSEDFAARLSGLRTSEWPLQRNGMPREGYLFPFSVKGLSALRRLSDEPWPIWAEAAARGRAW